MKLFKTIGILAGLTVSQTFAVENIHDQPIFMNISMNSQGYESEFIDVINDYEDPMEDTNETLDVINTDEDLTEYEYDAITALYNSFSESQVAPLVLTENVGIGANLRCTDLIVKKNSILDLNGFNISANRLCLEGKIINSSNRDARIDTPQGSINVSAHGTYPLPRSTK